MSKWENYLSVYSNMFERRNAEKGYALTLLPADFPVDDLECQEDDET